MSNTRTASLLLGATNRLTLSFTAYDEDLALGSIDLVIGSQKIGTGFELPARSVSRFCQDLVALHRDLAGTACVEDCLRTFQLSFAVADKRFGAIAVSGHFFTEARGAGWRDRTVGLGVKFEDWMTDQSFLPQFISALEGRA